MTDRFDANGQGALRLLRVLGGGAAVVPPKVPRERQEVEPRELGDDARTVARPEAVRLALDRLADLCELAAERLRDPEAFRSIGADGAIELDRACREVSAELAALERSMIASDARAELDALEAREVRWFVGQVSRSATALAFGVDGALEWLARRER